MNKEFKIDASVFPEKLECPLRINHKNSSCEKILVHFVISDNGLLAYPQCRCGWIFAEHEYNCKKELEKYLLEEQ